VATGSPPARICALTFTKRAAEELDERLTAALEPLEFLDRTRAPALGDGLLRLLMASGMKRHLVFGEERSGYGVRGRSKSGDRSARGDDK
jgi:superfamily I DNA/RNA helicase